MSTKVLRIWSGCAVVGVFSVNQDGGSVSLGRVGGAGTSTKVDIEIDPWAGLIVDHSTDNPPQAYREDQNADDDA